MLLLGCVRLFETPWIVAHQVPLSMEFSRQKILELVAISSSRGIFPTQGSNLRLLYLYIGRQILYHCDNCYCEIQTVIMHV